AVLKALGFVRSQVFAAVAWQATTLVGLALLVGLPLGVAAGRWTWQVFAGRLGAASDARVPVLAALVAVPVAIAIANAVAVAPGGDGGPERLPSNRLGGRARGDREADGEPAPRTRDLAQVVQQ